MANTKVNPIDVLFVREIGCNGNVECSKVLTINNGIPLPCKEYSIEDSVLLRERMLTDTQLFNSGFIRRVERSSLGNSLKIRKRGIDVGRVRTQSSGAPAVNQCKVVFDSVKMKDFEKTFYVVNTSKNLEFCTKDLIGTKWQDVVGNAISDYQADAFADSDMADVLIAAIMKAYKEWLPKFALLATCNSPAEDMHGDDGIFAKAYYAGKQNIVHTIEYDFSVLSTPATENINALVGGDTYDKLQNEFPDVISYMEDFVLWLNTRMEVMQPLFNASLNSSTSILTVASNFATRYIDLQIVLNDGTAIEDWGCKETIESLYTFTDIQRPILINDKPLLFQYETIDYTNFAEKFLGYKRDFRIYLHNNGFGDEVTDSDIRIGIDPILLEQKQGQVEQNYLSGLFNPDYMSQLGLVPSQFVPLNSLTGTGFFFITITENILMFDDGDNFMNAIENMGRFRILEDCAGTGIVKVLGAVPPVGFDVEHWGLFACNVEGSWLVTQNKLDQREPCQNAKLNLVCYDEDTKNDCLTIAGCSLTVNVSSEIAYDEGTDETTITVTVDSNTPTGTTLAYSTTYSLSEGTGGTSTDKSFVITLPGKQTGSGLVLSALATVTASGASSCVGKTTYSTRFGTGDGVTYCVGSVTKDQASDALTTSLMVNYTIGGNTEQIPLPTSSLSFNNTAHYASIETQIEAILVGTNVELSKVGTVVTVSITNIPSYLSDISIESGASGFKTSDLTIDCSN